MPRIDTTAISARPGRPYPLGLSVGEEGMRFTIFSRHATRVWLCFFENVEDHTPAYEYAFDPDTNRVGDVWSVLIRGLPENVYYKYRMDGPFDENTGHRYNAHIYLLDPYARAFVGDIHDGTMKCVAAHLDVDRPCGRHPLRPMRETIIYETHVRGFTQHGSSNVAHPGTYRGLIEKIPYLVDLGVTAVELLPINEFGETRLGRCSVDGTTELTNYWGYSSIGFFAPTGRYACSAVVKEHVEEFREMVTAMHDAGLEVILDVVFNHTSEGNERGPTLSFRGIDNSIYYLLGPSGEYTNYSGCGNTVRCDHPLVRDFILDCLRYWVTVMHVDGFRFDLASILGRGDDGQIREDAPLIRRIAEDPVLRGTKLIAEAWDAGGGYQVGSFGGRRWAEWNGRYRDDVRRYWLGDPGTRPAFASRITGSADIYQGGDRSPEHSINFITCHDGFTLHDLVSYRQKHNWANGEGNRDGSNDNISMNCGVEGPTDDPDILALRHRMQKNHLATLFLSLGVPMLLGGDEFSRTQGGNNNAYCQDNEISWYDWRLLETEGELHRFTKALIALRKQNAVFQREHYFNGNGPSDKADVLWFSPDGTPVDWDSDETPVAYRINGRDNEGVHIFLAFNNTEEVIPFTLPKGTWHECVNTGRAAPHDIAEGNDSGNAVRTQLDLRPRSLALLTQEDR